jgi:DNA-binding CsgD family transcriptional regulator
MDLGLAEAASGETSSLARFEDALRRVEEPSEQADPLYALGHTLFQYGRHQEAATTFRRGADMFRERDHDVALRFEVAYACVAMYVAPLIADARARLERAAAPVLTAGPATPGERALLSVLAHARSRASPPAQANAALAQAALGDGALLREQTSDSLVVSLEIYALLWSGLANEAQKLAEDALADARERGSVLAFAEASLARAVVMLALGRITEAMADSQTVREGMERGWHKDVPAAQAILINCLIERGELATASTVVDEVEALLVGPELKGLNAWFYRARGRLRLARCDHRAALEDFLAAGRDIEPYGPNQAMLRWRSYAALAAHAIGDVKQAVALGDAELEIARAFGLPAQIGAALRARAVVAPADVAQRLLEESAQVLTDADAPLELAYTLFELGRLHRRAGRRIMCREPLRRAGALAETCGAIALQTSAREELLASGARPRRSALSGLAALTPSERRIAELAAAGQTNRTIAETLFLTKNTVEWHLRHVYQKLDVGSREALRSLLDQEGESAAVV